MVEAEMISFALLASPRSALWDRLSPRGRGNLTKWLCGMHGKFIHPSNWLWFRVFTNLALLKVCGMDTTEIRASMQSDLEELDKFYLSDGWSSDGLWRSQEHDEKEYDTFLKTGRANTVPQGRQACYYSGSFAIQFSQLLYVRFARDLDPERAEMYCQRARNFGRGFASYFDTAGRYSQARKSATIFLTRRTAETVSYRSPHSLRTFSNLSFRMCWLLCSARRCRCP
jgi:hypothetical protein